MHCTVRSENKGAKLNTLVLMKIYATKKPSMVSIFALHVSTKVPTREIEHVPSYLKITMIR